MIPVFVVTGFLGSGKPPLLNRLIQHPRLADTALIVNEFGEIGIDHLLVERSLESTVLLASGCLCCTVRGDLIDTLGDLAAKRDYAVSTRRHNHDGRYCAWNEPARRAP